MQLTYGGISRMFASPNPRKSVDESLNNEVSGQDSAQRRKPVTHHLEFKINVLGVANIRLQLGGFRLCLVFREFIIACN